MKCSKQRNKLLFEDINSGKKMLIAHKQLPGTGKLFKDSP